MRRLGILVASLAVLLLVQSTVAQPPGFVTIMELTPDAVRGGELAAERCAGCHGADGNSVNPAFPLLAGQLRPYELIQLWAFRENERPGEFMNQIAADLSDQDIADLTAHFSGQTPAGAPWEGQDAAMAEQGGQLFGVGNHAGGVIACAVCHGGNGEGVEQLGIPRIAGQAPDYLKKVIVEFANLPDTGIPEISAMTINVSRLTDEEIDAIVAFLASQPWGGP